jgi:DNA-binding NarL/FixJ family response regulator
MTGRARILCVEDDAETVELMVEVLQEAGYDTLTARTGAEGARVLAQNPDLIICDIEMPSGDGFLVLRQVREAVAPRSETPFIFVTAHSNRDTHLRARQLGCDDFIAKPIDFELLLEMVRHRLRHAAGDQPSRITLTPREAEVMTWVAKGKSSGDIATLIGASERTVNFHVNNVLQKLGVATRLQAAVRCAQLGLIDVA